MVNDPDGPRADEYGTRSHEDRLWRDNDCASTWGTEAHLDRRMVWCFGRSSEMVVGIWWKSLRMKGPCTQMSTQCSKRDTDQHTSRGLFRYLNAPDSAMESGALFGRQPRLLTGSMAASLTPTALEDAMVRHDGCKVASARPRGVS